MPEILSPADGAARQASAGRDIERRLAGLETARNVPAALGRVEDNATIGATDTLRVVRFRIPPGGYDTFFVAFAWERGDATYTEAWLECLGEQSSRFRLATTAGSMSFAWTRPEGDAWPDGVLTLDADGMVAMMRLFVKDTANTTGNQTVLTQFHPVWLRASSHPTLDADEWGNPTLDPFVP